MLSRDPLGGGMCTTTARSTHEHSGSPVARSAARTMTPGAQTRAANAIRLHSRRTRPGKIRPCEKARYVNSITPTKSTTVLPTKCMLIGWCWSYAPKGFTLPASPLHTSRGTGRQIVELWHPVYQDKQEQTETPSLGLRTSASDNGKVSTSHAFDSADAPGLNSRSA